MPAIVTSGQLAFWTLVSTLGGCSICLFINWNRNKGNKHPYPPGPKGKPIIKNLLDLPAQEQWLAATEWAREYGDIVHLNVVGNHIVFLNSYEKAVELLDKRSAVYSDRMHTPMFELMDITRYLSLARYGNDFRLGRRIMHQEFNATSVLKYRVIQGKYACQVLRLLKEKPASYGEHFRFFASGIILEIIYGFRIQSVDDPHVEIAERGLMMLEGGVPGAFLVDTFPILKCVPKWIPGATFKHKAELWRRYALESRRIPFEAVSQSFDEGTAVPSFTTSWLSRISTKSSDEEKDRYKDALESVAGTAYLAGLETTRSTLILFMLCMIENPQAQRKAQMELDEVVGRGRLPEFSDMGNLPYINALLKEVFRRYPVTPLALPHRANADDEYQGMAIPKDTMVFPNVWAMSLNPEQYGEDADAFKPERFINSDARDPLKYIFGFGRRICPGRYMVKDSLFIIICYILHVFRIGNPTNEDGSEKPLELEWKNSMGLNLLPFSCSITLRFPGAEKLIP